MIRIGIVPGCGIDGDIIPDFTTMIMIIITGIHPVIGFADTCILL